MATYVNLNVNQGLINKAKQVQGANRNSLANKQKAAQKAKEKNETGRKFGSEFRRRKVGAADNGLSTIGFFTSKLTGGESQPIDPSDPIGKPGQIYQPFYRTFSTINGAAVFDDPELPAVTSQQINQQFNQTPIVRLCQLVLPVQGDVAIFAIRNTAAHPSIANGSPGPLPNTTRRFINLDSYLCLVISENNIRQITMPAQVKNILDNPAYPREINVNLSQLEPLFNDYQIYNINIGSYGFVWPFSLGFTMNPMQSFTPDFYGGLKQQPLNGPDFGVIRQNTDRALVEQFLGYDTELEIAPSPDGELVLYEFPDYNEETYALKGPSLIYDRSARLIVDSSNVFPEPRYAQPMGYQAVGSRLVYRPFNSFPEGGQIKTDKFTVYALPPYSNPGLVDTYAPEDQTEVICFWDWSAPDYCQQELLALGFSSDDFSP